jgi:putative phosphoesterase
MLIGLISDTHDRLPYINKAIKKLNSLGIDLVLHAGDYVSPFVVTPFKPLRGKMIGVYGNNDREVYLLKKKFKMIDIDIKGRFAEIDINEIKIALIHGDDENLLNSIIKSDYYNVVVHGHTHQEKISKKGNTSIINPGEICGYLSGRSTMVILETKKTTTETIFL